MNVVYPAVRLILVQPEAWNREVGRCSLAACSRELEAAQRRLGKALQRPLQRAALQAWGARAAAIAGDLECPTHVVPEAILADWYALLGELAKPGGALPAVFTGAAVPAHLNRLHALPNDAAQALRVRVFSEAKNANAGVVEWPIWGPG